jgi:hypothetical protein
MLLLLPTAAALSTSLIFCFSAHHHQQNPRMNSLSKPSFIFSSSVLWLLITMFRDRHSAVARSRSQAQKDFSIFNLTFSSYTPPFNIKSTILPPKSLQKKTKQTKQSRSTQFFPF